MPTLRLKLRLAAAGVAASLVLIGCGHPLAGAPQNTLPASLSSAEFWALSESLSEPGGYFRSNSGSPDNLLSNEGTISTVAAALERSAKPSGVYLGVGPEQNFTYIAAIKPRLAIITDIRRGNLHLHLLYKAAFELSDDRVAFLSRVFARKRPASVTAAAGIDELMSAFLSAEPMDEAGFQANFQAIVNHLTKTRGLPLGKDDVDGIEYVHRNFHQFGPAIHYTSSIGGRSGGTYAFIMRSRDTETGRVRTYLATPDTYAELRAMQRKNLIVPIVGDFAGPKSLRAVGSYLRARGAVLRAFYVSNVEDYLRRNGVWPAFCANVASMPLDSTSVFIRPSGARPFSSMQEETAACGSPRGR